jgi:transketolase
MRTKFADEMFTLLGENKDTWLLLGDVGYGIFDEHRKTYHNRVINVGAAEHTMICMAVGLAMEGKLVFVYTITPFLLWRGAEVIRNYIHHEKIPVKLIGSGRGRDYEKDGYSHWCEEDAILFDVIFRNIKTYRPKIKEEIPAMFQDMVANNLPCYLNLRR